MVESRCGILCSECEYRKQVNRYILRSGKAEVG